MAETVLHHFFETARRHPEKTAVRFCRKLVGQGNLPSDNWLSLTWGQYKQLVESLAAGLQTGGVRKGGRVAILSSTRLEWAALDLAILGLGAVTVPIYPSSTPEDVAFILQDSQARTFIVENEDTFLKIKPAIAHLLPQIKVILVETPTTPTPLTTLDLLQQSGEIALKTSPTLMELATKELSLDDIATIIYTSGTTGRPKGVIHTHQQAISEVSEAFPLLGVSSNDTTLTFLPFAHVLGRIEIWGHAVIGYTMGFAESIDRIKQGFQAIRPTILIAVPRIFEKIHAGILA
ncbi:MAG: AMP-binding protein, partial [Bdellovibrionales bacterium]|nr:AMP-binding protein [Bdellovibrionales bacterium]